MSFSRRLHCLVILVGLFPVFGIVLAVSAADRWPEWRGATGQGHSTATGLPVRWSESEHVAWKSKLPGLGWSTPVVENGIVWVTTAVDRPSSKEDAKRRRKASTNSQPLTISEFVSLRAVGVDLKTGIVRYDIEVLNEVDPQMIHLENSYATPTPIIDNGRLYCHFGPAGSACLDVATETVLWSNRTLRVKHENGPGSSPVLWNDLLIIHCDGIDQQYIVALDTRTGDIAWKTERAGELKENPQQRKAYATPLVTDVNGSPQVISPAADWLYGYHPQSGKELWRVNYGQLGFSNAARPVVGHGLIYTCTGFMKSELLAVRVDGRGDTPQAQVVWRFKKQVPNVASPLLVGDELYFASDKGVATCINAKTGELHWAERIGSRFWASPIYADGRIYFFDRDATTTVVAPATKFHQLAVNKLEGTMLAGAAVVDGAIILRTDQALYRINQDVDGSE
ncbi:MAG: PQQ-binding-like beta-propeller repeat protein [Pirellulaceae bacterium]|nr:PQQ-binding-like beta-propeller repeat protein [Pirellulaceae bacterium]MDP6718175.1 PQQ-binding-like beta-propeller repeat protein [Pirellulaceae bacterium]